MSKIKVPHLGVETQPNPELIVRLLYLKDSCYDNRKTLIYIFDTWDVRSRSLKHEKVHLQESVNQGVIPSHLAVLVERGRNTRALTSSATAISKHSAELSRQGLSNFTSVAVVMGYGSLHGVDRVPHVYDLSSGLWLSRCGTGRASGFPFGTSKTFCLTLNSYHFKFIH